MGECLRSKNKPQGNKNLMNNMDVNIGRPVSGEIESVSMNSMKWFQTEYFRISQKDANV